MTKNEKEVIRNCIAMLNHILIEDNKKVAHLRELDKQKHPEKYDKRTGLPKRKK